MLVEKQLQNEILREFGTKPWIRIWRANSGVARIGQRVVRFGIPGQADLTGIIAGKRLEIEVKASGKQSLDQMNFQNMIKKFGGIYILAHSVEDIYEKLAAYGIVIR